MYLPTTAIFTMKLSILKDRTIIWQGGRFVKMRIIEESIPVKGQSDDIPLRIRLTRHGPIINAIYEAEGTLEGSSKKEQDRSPKAKKNKENRLLAMRWTAREHHLNSLALISAKSCKKHYRYRKGKQTLQSTCPELGLW